MERSTIRIALLWTAALTMGSAGRAQDLRVTDPAMIERMGLTSDTNAFIAKGAILNQTPTDNPEFGTAVASSTTAMGNMFQPRVSTGAYNTTSGRGDIAFVSGDVFFDTQLNLPAGALWDSTSFWGSDSDATDINFFLFRSCTPAAAPGSPDVTLLGNGSTSGVTGNYFVTVVNAAPPVIDNAACVYWARANFGAAGQSLTKARSQWRRQVSPAPAVATFGVDVPTDHPFFRFIEALAAAGITGGCGPAQYCPNSPVTRGQMAVFLSIALGLHFPN